MRADSAFADYACILVCCFWSTFALLCVTHALQACERDCSKQVHAMAADIFGASESSPEVLPLGSLLAAKGSCWETVQGAWMAPNPGTSCRVQPGQAVLNLKELGSPLLRSELAALHAGVMELVHEQRGEGAQDKVRAHALCVCAHASKHMHACFIVWLSMPWPGPACTVVWALAQLLA